MARYNDLDMNNWKEYESILTDSLWIFDKRDNSGHDAHGNAGQKQRLVGKCQSGTDRQSIDAGGNGGKYQRFPTEKVKSFTFDLLIFTFFLPAVKNHLSADKTQQSESDPVAERGDKTGKEPGKQKSGKRHEKLKKSKIKRRTEGVSEHFSRAVAK